MLAKFPGKCTTCEGIIEKGDIIFWTIGAGARHETCPTEDSKPPIIESDPTEYKDSTTHDWKDCFNVTNCQKCGVLLNRTPKDPFYAEGAEGKGFRVVCKKCFR